jgi:hypothetical protein
VDGTTKAACCGSKCTNYACITAGKILKATLPSISVAASDALCCDTACVSSVCTTGFSPKTSYGTIAGTTTTACCDESTMVKVELDVDAGDEDEVVRALNTTSGKANLKLDLEKMLGLGSSTDHTIDNIAIKNGSVIITFNIKATNINSPKISTIKDKMKGNISFTKSYGFLKNMMTNLAPAAWMNVNIADLGIKWGLAKCSTIKNDSNFCGTGGIYDPTKAGSVCGGTTCSNTTGSTDLNTCCKKGCPAGRWGLGTTSNPCTKCPGNKTSNPSRNRTVTDCFCSTGSSPDPDVSSTDMCICEANQGWNKSITVTDGESRTCDRNKWITACNDRIVSGKATKDYEWKGPLLPVAKQKAPTPATAAIGHGECVCKRKDGETYASSKKSKLFYKGGAYSWDLGNCTKAEAMKCKCDGGISTSNCIGIKTSLGGSKAEDEKYCRVLASKKACVDEKERCVYIADTKCDGSTTPFVNHCKSCSDGLKLSKEIYTSDNIFKRFCGKECKNKGQWWSTNTGSCSWAAAGPGSACKINEFLREPGTIGSPNVCRKCDAGESKIPWTSTRADNGTNASNNKCISESIHSPFCKDFIKYKTNARLKGEGLCMGCKSGFKIMNGQCLLVEKVSDEVSTWDKPNMIPNDILGLEPSKDITYYTFTIILRNPTSDPKIGNKETFIQDIKKVIKNTIDNHLQAADKTNIDMEAIYIGKAEQTTGLWNIKVIIKGGVIKNVKTILEALKNDGTSIYFNFNKSIWHFAWFPVTADQISVENAASIEAKAAVVKSDPIACIANGGKAVQGIPCKCGENQCEVGKFCYSATQDKNLICNDLSAGDQAAKDMVNSAGQSLGDVSDDARNLKAIIKSLSTK